MAGFDVFIGGHGEEMRMQRHGDIFELVGIEGPLSDSDLAVLEGYLKQKHDVRERWSIPPDSGPRLSVTSTGAVLPRSGRVGRPERE